MQLDKIEGVAVPTWMNRTKEQDRARIADIRAKRQEAGNCILCGCRRSDDSKQLCEKHLIGQRAYQLRRYHQGKRVK